MRPLRLFHGRIPASAGPLLRAPQSHASEWAKVKEKKQLLEP